jgi:electron transport complex protein RnfA
VEETVSLITLAVFSGLSVNLMLHLGLGIQNFNADRPIKFAFFQWVVLFLSILLLWCFFSYIISSLSLGYFIYFMIFPASVAAGKGIEMVYIRLFPLASEKPRRFSFMDGYNGLIITALILVLQMAITFSEAAMLSLGFSMGVFVSILILKGILKRSSMEKVPAKLRGLPLQFISMAFLSLIFSSLAVLFLHVLGN